MFFSKYQLIITVVIAWAAAQLSKTVLYAITNHEFRPERFIGNGGMPSSHSALVCSFSTACLLKYGFDSYEFAMAMVFALVVITDAVGVRRVTGKQSEILNLIIGDPILNFKNIDPDKRLKELIGHTPLQVAVGGILGILIAYIIWRINNG